MAVGFSASGQHYQALTGLPASTYTFTAWVRPSAVGTRNRAVYWFRQSSNESFSGISIRDNPTNLQMIDGASYGFSGVGQVAAAPDTWYQVAAVIDGADATFYRAAVGDPLAAASVANFTPAATPNQLWLGTDPFGGWWEGRIASVKVWAAALDAAEVAAELGQYAPRRTDGLQRWHPFLTAEVTDYSGNGNTLTGGTGTTTEDGPPIPWAPAIPHVFVPAAQVITGTMTAGLPPLSAAGTATAIVTGAAAPTLPALDSDLDAAARVTGAATLGLPSLATGAAGQTVVGAAPALGLPSLSAAASGTVIAPAGSLAGTLPALGAALAGESEVTGLDGPVRVGPPRLTWQVRPPVLGEE